MVNWVGWVRGVMCVLLLGCDCLGKIFFGKL